MGDQDAARAIGNNSANEMQELTGAAAVERGGRLVENDKTQWQRSDGEGAGNLDHLALADRQIADHVRRPDTMPGKDFVQLGLDEIAGALAPPRPFMSA